MLRRVEASRGAVLVHVLRGLKGTLREIHAARQLQEAVGLLAGSGGWAVHKT